MPTTPTPAQRRPARPASRRCLTAALALAALAPAARLRAQDAAPSPAPPAAPARPRTRDLSVALKATTLGYGVEVGKLLASHAGVRVGGYLVTYNRQQELDGNAYDASLTLRGGSVLLDLFPGRRGAFRLTGGVLAGTSEVAGTGVAGPDGSFTLNDREYTGTQVGALVGSVRFPRVRPYAGIGWGTPASRRGGLGFVSDFGVAYGKPALALRASGAGAADPRLAADLAAERQSMQKNLDRYAKLYPVIGLGLAYRF